MNTETNTAATLTRAPMVDLSLPDQIAAWKPDAELLPEQKLTVEECTAAYKAARASTGLKAGFDTLVKAKMVAFHLAPTNPRWVWLAMANLVVRQLKAKLAPSPQDRRPRKGPFAFVVDFFFRSMSNRPCQGHLPELGCLT
jgi:hypothetical protein